MKKAALSSGADEAPTSSTLGTESGRGVVSMRTVWLNLRLGGGLAWWFSLGCLFEAGRSGVGRDMKGGGFLPGLSGGHGGC